MMRLHRRRAPTKTSSEMPTETPAPSAPAASARPIALLPDHHFFVRVIPLATGEGVEPVPAQVELALESLAPFPVGQLYYGHFTRPGAARAVVFASYRKRFPADESDTWGSADLVTPAFATLLGAPVPAGATTWVIDQPEGLTAVHFGDDSGVPTDVRMLTLSPDADAAQRAASRATLLRAFPGSRTVVDVPAPVFDPEKSEESAWVFRAGDLVSTLPATLLESLDVRDKGELAVLRQAQRRDQWLWRALVGFLALIVACGVAELGLLGARLWLETRAAEVAVQRPDVDNLMNKRTLATRIEDLSSKRLLPLEMFTIVSEARPGGNIQFLTMSTSGRYTLQIAAQTASATIGDIDAFQSALSRHEAIESVEVQGPENRAGVAAFRLTVVFKPDAVKPADS